LKHSLPICDHTPAPYDGPSKEEVLALRHQYLSPGIITYYRDPLMIVEGHMQYVWDEAGRQYLDCFAGIVTISVGHCHPKIVERVSRTVEEKNTTLQSYAKIKKFTILPADFTMEGGELTPTLKLKRRVVAEKYRQELEALYG